MNDYKKLEEVSRAQQDSSGSHGYEHTERVVKLCKVIGSEYNADMNVLIPAAILHDIGRPSKDHAKKGGLKVRNILMKENWDSEIVEKIIHAIESHSFSSNRVAQTLEAQILSDADKLDALGCIGIYRAAQFSLEFNRSFEDFIAHFYEKLLNLKHLMYTKKAKEMAMIRHEFIISYLNQVNLELEGSI